MGAMVETQLNKVLRDLLEKHPDFSHLPRVPIAIRVIMGSNPGEMGWGFINQGDMGEIEWLYRTGIEAMLENFPEKRWIRAGVPPISREEILGALAQVIHSNDLRRRHGEDTLGVLAQAGVFHHLQDPEGGVVALAALIDKVATK